LFTFTSVLAGFALLGIGNTIVQVSANPLLVDVVPQGRASSFLSLSQFIKAIGSMIAAPFAGWLAITYGDWKLLFIVFGIVTAVSVVWLATTPIAENRNSGKKASFSSTLSLLSVSFIAWMVLGIFLVVGIDVGINAVSGQYFINRFQSAQTFAESGRSIYFLGKMLGTFAGAILLTKINPRLFFRWTSLFTLLFTIILLIAPTEMFGMAVIFLIGLSAANVFPLIFALTVEKYAQRANEISGLMIMAVSGGAVVPLLIGWLTDVSGLVTGLLVLSVSAVYLLVLAFIASGKRLK
jgi:fucose permease